MQFNLQQINVITRVGSEFNDMYYKVKDKAET